MIWGYYGVNYGDDIMLIQLVEQCARWHIKPEIITFAPKSEFSKPLEQVRLSGVGVTHWYGISRDERLVFLLQHRRWIHIWGGGTVFTDHEGDGNLQYFRLLYWLGAKFAYFSCGISALRSPQRVKAAKWLLRRSSLSLLRDSTSGKIARDLGGRNLHVTADVVLLYAEAHRPDARPDPAHILLTYRRLDRHFSTEDELNIRSAVIAFMVRKSKKFGLPVVVQAVDAVEDRPVCQSITDELRRRGLDATFVPDADASMIENNIARAALHVSGRLHGSMISEVFGTPTVSLVYCRKMKELAADIGDGHFVDLEGFEPTRLPAVSIDEKRGWSIPSELLDKAANNIRLLENLLRERGVLGDSRASIPAAALCLLVEFVLESLLFGSFFSDASGMI